MIAPSMSLITYFLLIMGIYKNKSDTYLHKTNRKHENESIPLIVQFEIGCRHQINLNFNIILKTNCAKLQPYYNVKCYYSTFYS